MDGPHGPMREERRTITAVFADVAGSTALAERLDPEDVREIVGEAVRQMAEIVESFGGTVKDVAGDGILALFGAPVTHEDDAERAVLAGLEIQRRIREHAQTVRLAHDIEFGVRVGIETGLVVTGPVGGGTRVEYGATGDVVNTAARLQGRASVGSVLVGPSTRARVEALFTWSDPRLFELKGKDGTVETAEALERRADASRARQLPGRGAPLVGRDTEVAVGNGSINRLAEGNGGTLVVAGEAGIGKSRLLEELRTGSPPTVRWLEGACTSLASSTPYAPIAELLSSWRHTAGPERRPEDLVPADRPEARAALAVLAGVARPGDTASFEELSPDGRQLATIEALRSFFRATSAESPTAVVLEDLHWCDPSSLNAIDRLLPLGRTEPIAFVLTTRTERDNLSAAVLDRAARTSGPFRRIDLDALPEGTDRQLVSALVGAGTLPPSLLGRILEVGAGNPFFLGELVRSLIAAGAIVPINGGWRAATDARPELPDTIERVLLARIDRLPGEDRDVLTAASVLGRRFGSNVLRTLLETDPHTALDRLTDLDLVRPEPPDHAFAHVLVQETAYGTLPRKRRRELHARAAVAIEEMGDAESSAAVLGRHHAGAGDVDQALRWFTTAADRAEASSALLEAIENLDAALEVAGPDTDGLAGLRWRRGRLRGRTGDHRGARSDLDESLRVAVERGDRALEMHCLDEIGFLVAGSADYRASVEPLERALAIADELGDAAGRVSALSRLTLTSANRLQLDRAERSGALALEIASATGDEQLVATALDALKQVSLMTGRFDEVERFGAQLRPLYERRHDRWLQQFVELETGLSSFMRWRFDEARDRLERSLAINRELNDDGNEPLHIMMLSHYHRCRGAVAPAIETGRRSLTLARERGHLEWIAQAASILGGTLLQLGAREEAIDVLRSGVDAAERSGAAIHAIQCTGQLVRAVSSSSDEEAVRAVLRSAEAELAQVGLPPGELLLFDWDGLIGIAAGWIVASAPERALELTDPIVQACVARGWPEAAVDASLVRAAALTALEDREGALEAARLADEWCQRYEVPLYAWRAAEAVASCADAGEAEEARERARASADALLASIDEASLRSHLADEVDRVIARGGAAWA